MRINRKEQTSIREKKNPQKKKRKTPAEESRMIMGSLPPLEIYTRGGEGKRGVTKKKMKERNRRRKKEGTLPKISLH